MNFHLGSICKRSLITIAVIMALLLFIRPSVYAQAEPTATTAVSPTATISTTAVTSVTMTAQVVSNALSETVVEPAEAAETENTAKAILRWLVGVTLLFSTFVLVGMFIYTYRVQMKYYEVMEKFSRAGMTLRTKVIATFSQSNGLNADGSDTTFTLTIEGPTTLMVNTPSEEFTATLDPVNPDSVISWTITPVDGAAIIPTTGKKVKVVAVKPGTYTLKATTEVNGQIVSAEDSVNVVAPTNSAVELPFVGSGYGSWAIAIVLITALMILGFAGILSGEGIIGIFGALAGYIFGVKITNASVNSSSGESTE